MYDDFLTCLMILTIAMMVFAVLHSVYQIANDLSAKAALREAVKQAKDPQLEALREQAAGRKLDRSDLEILRVKLEDVAKTLPEKVSRRVLKGTTQNRRDDERNYNLSILLG